MAPTERSAILGTMDQGLLVAKNAQMRQFLEPQDAAEGAAILQAFSDPARPATVFLSGQQRHMINAPLHAMAIEVVGRWRSQQGPSSRSLQVIIDEAPKLPPIPWLREVMIQGAPAGTAILIVDQNASYNRLKRTWFNPDLSDNRADHVLQLPSNGLSDGLAIIQGLTGQKVTQKDVLVLNRVVGVHLLINKDGIQVVSTPYLFAPRDKLGG